MTKTLPPALRHLALVSTLLVIAGCSMSTPTKGRIDATYPEPLAITGIPGL